MLSNWPVLLQLQLYKAEVEDPRQLSDCRQVVFFTDALSALETLSGDKLDTETEFMKGKFHQVCQERRVTLQWVPSHCGMLGRHSRKRCQVQLAICAYRVRSPPRVCPWSLFLMYINDRPEETNSSKSRLFADYTICQRAMLSWAMNSLISSLRGAAEHQAENQVTLHERP